MDHTTNFNEFQNLKLHFMFTRQSEISNNKLPRKSLIILVESSTLENNPWVK
jgi:hypothetical protein